MHIYLLAYILNYYHSNIYNYISIMNKINKNVRKKC